MIIFMFKIICITNRKLCAESYVSRLEKIAQACPDGIILREKDLDENEYYILASETADIFRKYSVEFIMHNFTETALRLKYDKIHLPLSVLRESRTDILQHFSVIGCSCHSIDEAKEAERLGAAYITAGHIFATDCKPGLAPRGIEFLRNICKEVSIPVYAIGGICISNIKTISDIGAAGCCIMSGFMQCDNVNEYLTKLREAVK